MGLKNVLRGTISLPNIVIVTVLIKIAFSQLSFPSALLLIAAVIMFCDFDYNGKVNALEKDLTELEAAVSILTNAQEEVSKQSEQTKALLSKANIATAFAPKSRG